MTNQPQRRTIPRSTVLQHVRLILKDGKPRTAQQLVVELRRFDFRFASAGIAKLLSETKDARFVFDPHSATYRFVEQPADASVRQPAVTALATPVNEVPKRVERAQEPRFSLRQRVRLAADHTRRGRIVDGPRAYSAGYEYCVVFGDDEGWFAETDLEAVPLDGMPRWQTRDEFLRDLLLAKLRGQLTDSLYSYQASRTEFVPYQFRPALKFLRNPDQRILIADEVGLGKTIEAAIIYLELKARMNISRVLVLCPSRLKSKWQDELRNRFEEEFVELDSTRLRTFLEDTQRLGGNFPFKAIASFEMMRSSEFVDAWTERHIPLDLLIVDEAHYMRNQDTRTFQLGAALTDSADAVVFLTATPLHLRNRDLYNLLHLLMPGEYGDPDLFEAQVEPNASVIQAAQYLAARSPEKAAATLRQVEQTVLRDRFLKNPYYHEVLRKLGAGVSGDRERIALQRELVELNTLSSLFTRTRKREVSTAAVRSAHTICVELTPSERRFYESVVENVQQELAGRVGAQSFATIMKERQAASCLAAMREAVAEGSTRDGTRLLFERSAFEGLGDESDQKVRLPQQLQRSAQQIGQFDSKFNHFIQILERARAETPDSKILVFSFFRRTLEYLKRRLTEHGYTVEVLNGDVPVPDRKRVIERFRNEPQIRIMLSSEVGAEGLDFQFCDILVNYDLPWNPMQVEQRIGRLDRFGQEHEKIRIYNFYIAETIETRIFQRLYDRIGIFERSIGDLEAILGEEIKQLSEAALRPSLTPQEQERLAEAAADRIVQRQLASEELEREKDQLLGHEAIFNQQIQDTVASGRVIAAEEVRALVLTFMADRFPRVQVRHDGDEPCWTLRMTPEFVTEVEQFMLGETRDSGLSPRFLDAMHRDTLVALTFDSELARKRPLLEFVTARHPLARMAAEHWRGKAAGGVPAAQIEIEGLAPELGTGYFFVYQLAVTGARAQSTLQPVVIMDDGRVADIAAETLLSQIQRTTATPTIGYDAAGYDAARAAADGAVAHQRDKLRDETLRRNQALVAAQKAATRTSFEAKMRRAKEQALLATDERISRMREAQVRNLKAKMELRLKELDHRSNVSVSYSLVAAGRLRIVPPKPESTARPADRKAKQDVTAPAVLHPAPVSKHATVPPVVPSLQTPRTPRKASTPSQTPSAARRQVSDAAAQRSTPQVAAIPASPTPVTSRTQRFLERWRRKK